MISLYSTWIRAPNDLLLQKEGDNVLNIGDKVYVDREDLMFLRNFSAFFQHLYNLVGKQHFRLYTGEILEVGNIAVVVKWKLIIENSTIVIFKRYSHLRSRVGLRLVPGEIYANGIVPVSSRQVESGRGATWG